MKKYLKNAIAIITCGVLIFVIAACTQNAETQGTKISFCSASKTVMRDENYSGGDFILNTFKGDVEGGQIIINPDKDVNKFNFKVKDLSLDGGDAKLSADLFEVYAERYINVYQSTSGNTYTGWYPDALVPIKNYAAKRDNKISKGDNQGIWINVNIPQNAVPGTYKGTGELTLDDETIEVPMTVNVYDIDMPDEVHAVTSYYINPQMISKFDKPATDEYHSVYYEFALSKRVTPICFPDFPGVNQKYDAAEYADAVAEYVKDLRITSYALPYVGDGSGVVDQSYCEEILSALAEKNVELIQKGENVDLFKKAHFYLGALIDEPVPEKYDRVRECDLRIQKAKLKIAASEILEDYPELQESVKKLKHVVTCKITSQLYGTDEVGGVQTWCPTTDHFSGEKARALAIERMNSSDRTGGEGVWWYGCCFPVNPYPTYHIDDDYLTMRLMKWMQYDYKIQGSIYWELNYWDKQVNNKQVSGNPWEDPLSFEGCNGDGRLIYPGAKYAVNGPISTLRMEGIRESAEDYELLWLAEKGIESINEEFGKNYDPDKILKKFYSRLYNDVFLKDGVTVVEFENVRCELMELVVKIYRDKSSAISLIDNYNV